MTSRDEIPVYDPPTEPQDRTDFAFDSALLDVDLIEKIVSEGHDKDRVIGMACNLMGRLQRGEITCATLKNEIRRNFPKRKGPSVRDTILKYRTELLNWINGVSPLRYPPNLAIQNLPPLNSNTLTRYCRLYEKYRNNDNRPAQPDTTASREEARARGGNHEVFRYDVESANPGSVSNYEFDYPAYNLQNILVDYVRQSERNALEVLMYIISIGNTRRFFCYRGVIVHEAIRKLSGNIHFIRSLFNVLDEVIHTQNLDHQFPMLVLADIMRGLNAAGVTAEYNPEEDVIINPDEPRDFHQHTITMQAENADLTYRFPIRVPSNYVPAHWNITRIVNPSANESFQEFSRILERDSGSLDQRLEEGARYMNELENNRRYGLEFSRIKVTEIPGTENMDVWFYYSRDPEMEPGEMRIEVLVNDGSIVYFFNNGILETRERGICIPRVPDEEFGPDHVDAMFRHPTIRNWASNEAQRALFFYIVKYAHALLVLPRTTGTVSPAPGDPNNARFNFRLTEHSTQTHMPGLSTGENPGRPGRTITAFHGVDPYVRQLPPGHRASPEAIAEAARHRIFLAPGQTFVSAYTRGSEITEQGRKGRGIERDI